MKSTLLRLLATVGVGVAGLTTGLAASAPLPGTPDESGIKACADYSTSPHSDGVYDPTTGKVSRAKSNFLQSVSSETAFAPETW